MIVNGLGGLGSFMRRSGSANSNRASASSSPSSAASSSSSAYVAASASASPTIMLPASSKMDYVKLQPRIGSTFPPPHRTQLPPRFHSSLGSGGLPPRSSCHKNWWLLIPALLLLLFFFAFFSLSGKFSGSTSGLQRFQYAIVIDAGSSGSRLHIFRFTVAEGKIPVVDTTAADKTSLKSNPGLSTFATSPEKAGKSLIKLLSFARLKVPEDERAKTRLYLMATAGLRRLDPKIQDQILDSCRETLQRSGFLFKSEWASVITGTSEGIYAWVAANYALGTLRRNPDETVGIVELGGASMQVTFVPKVPPPQEFVSELELGGVNYKLYTYSFLNLGQEAAWESLLQLLFSGVLRTSVSSHGVVMDPCTPSGYVMSKEDIERRSMKFGTTSKLRISSVISTGNFSECRAAASKLLQIGHEACTYERCAIGSTFIPELRGSFFATENFFYTSEFFGLPATTSIAEVEAAGQQFCGSSWTKLQEVHKGTTQEDLLKYCFSTAYIVALLHDSLGVAMHDDRMRFTNKVHNIPLDWPLGALTVKLAKETHLQPTILRLQNSFVTIFSFLGIFLLVGSIGWLIFRCQRPRLKTIYDLEKGRYITTTARLHR